MKSKKMTFIDTLVKGMEQYYFEVYAQNGEAYIEKKNLSKNNSDASGWFTIEEARRCWKALKAKGFVTESEYENTKASE